MAKNNKRFVERHPNIATGCVIFTGVSAIATAITGVAGIIVGKKVMKAYRNAVETLGTAADGANKDDIIDAAINAVFDDEDDDDEDDDK